MGIFIVLRFNDEGHFISFYFKIRLQVFWRLTLIKVKAPLGAISTINLTVL